jgi:hypothetical protein
MRLQNPIHRCCAFVFVLQGASRWLVLHNARLLLGCIKLMLFFLAFVISQSVYFAAFFGAESCFFSRTGAQCGKLPCCLQMAAMPRHQLRLLIQLQLCSMPLFCCVVASAWQQLAGGCWMYMSRVNVKRSVAAAPLVITPVEQRALCTPLLCILIWLLMVCRHCCCCCCCMLLHAGFQKNPVPWYGIVIIDICLLLSLALFTLPLYTITSHTLRADKRLLQQIVQQQQQQQQGGTHAGSSHASGNDWEDEH